MTPIELFGVFVRVIGFCVTVYGTLSAVWGAAYLITSRSAPAESEEDKQRQQAPYFYLFLAGVLLPFGLLIIVQADTIARLAYPPIGKPLPTKSFRI